jgi:hypothetical protein
MKSNSTDGPTFNSGDEVVLTRNSHGGAEGSHGVFLRLRADSNWADITDSDGHIQYHPVEWLAHFDSTVQSAAK